MREVIESSNYPPEGTSWSKKGFMQLPLHAQRMAFCRFIRQITILIIPLHQKDSKKMPISGPAGNIYTDQSIRRFLVVMTQERPRRSRYIINPHYVEVRDLFLALDQGRLAYVICGGVKQELYKKMPSAAKLGA